MKIAVCTLGCKTNQFECQAMEKLFADMGYDVVSADSEADGYVVNSCTVTSTADKKTRQMLRHLRRAHPEALIAVCGCMTQVDAGDVREQCGVDLVGGNRDFKAFVAVVDEALRERKLAAEMVANDYPAFQTLPAGGLSGRTRALLKVEDGCENFCSYCIIPYARGPIRSLPLGNAIEETKKLCAQGYKEIVLTGIEISAYGIDLQPQLSICDLLEAVCAAAGETRISLGSLKPTVIDEEFCRRLSKLPNLCRHFHLSLQSGCTETLARMNRKYGADDILRAVSLLRTYFDEPNLTADIIVGFPGETEEEFAETLATLRTCSLGDAHIFPYSVRRGTKAEGIPGKHTNAVKKARAAECAAVCTELRNAYLDRWIGTMQRVLAEEGRDGSVGGYTDRYLFVRIENGETVARGSYADVLVTARRGGELIGEAIAR